MVGVIPDASPIFRLSPFQSLDYLGRFVGILLCVFDGESDSCVSFFSVQKSVRFVASAMIHAKSVLSVQKYPENVCTFCFSRSSYEGSVLK